MSNGIKMQNPKEQRLEQNLAKAFENFGCK